MRTEVGLLRPMLRVDLISHACSINRHISSKAAVGSGCPLYIPLLLHGSVFRVHDAAVGISEHLHSSLQKQSQSIAKIIFKYQRKLHFSSQTLIVNQKNDTTLSNWLISLIKKSRSQRNNASVTEISQIKRPVCTVNHKRQEITEQNISSPDKKLLTHSNDHCPCSSIEYIYCSERVQLVDVSVSVTHCRLFTMRLSLSSRFQTHTHHVSVCLALSLPPTTHSMLYKSYINASSTPFSWWAS